MNLRSHEESSYTNLHTLIEMSPKCAWLILKMGGIKLNNTLWHGTFYALCCLLKSPLVLIPPAMASTGDPVYRTKESIIPIYRSLKGSISSLNLTWRLSHVLNTALCHPSFRILTWLSPCAVWRQTHCLRPGSTRGWRGRYVHHTHKHMLHIAMETGISQRRPDSFFSPSFLSFCFLSSTKASMFGEGDVKGGTGC